MLYDIIAAIWRAILRTFQNDRIAFAAGIGMFVITWTGRWWLGALMKLTAWAYFIILYLAGRKGEKIELEKAFRKAVEKQKTGAGAGQTDEKPEPEKPEPEPEKPAPEQPEQKPVDIPKPVKRGIQFVGDFLSDEERLAEESFSIQRVEQHLKDTIKGQDHASYAVINTLKKALSGLKTKTEKPLCVFLLVGATGTGKTEIVKQIAAATTRPLVRFDMPNYSSEAGVWELIGSPPGYVGSDKPGRLTGEIRNNPNAVLLLDEIEKANQKIWDPFLRVLDEGKMRDQSQGFTADFKNVMIFLTSNLLQFEDFIEDEAVLRNKILNEGYFRPELLNRIDTIIMFKKFDNQTYRDIIALALSNYMQSFLDANKLNAEVRIDRAVIEYVLKNIDTKFGVRDVHRLIEKRVGDALADAYLSKQNKSEITTVSLVVRDGNLEVAL